MTRTRVRRLSRPDPEPCGGRKPAELVTDRALRYRANSEECQPEGPPRCIFCGARRFKDRGTVIEVGHFDGDETNTTPENLHWTCRSCNQRVAANMKRAGVGRRTHQYNPKKGRGATDVREFGRALAIIAGDQVGDLNKAIELIHNTGPRKRSELQSELWNYRKKLYGPSGRKDGGAVPF